ncbi:MAG: hypothetical protein JJU12_06600 [Chlamydiales bacterium]|nr:hypothetical protein [Chlamydiales bacterium]
MNTHKHHKVRLSVDCTEEERMYIKMLATKSHMTISEYLLSFARKEMPKCTRSHKPNKETQKALKEAQEKDETFESVDEFWDAMGMNPHAED